MQLQLTLRHSCLSPGTSHRSLCRLMCCWRSCLSLKQRTTGSPHHWDTSAETPGSWATHNEYFSETIMLCLRYRHSSLITLPLQSKGSRIGYRRCGNRVAHCWHSSCSPWSIPPPLPFPSYSSLSISSNICCTCRDAALSNSYGDRKTKREGDTDSRAS